MSHLEECVWAAVYVRRMGLEMRQGIPREIRIEDSIREADLAVEDLREAFARSGRTEDPIGAGAGASDPTPPAGPEDAASPAPRSR